MISSIAESHIGSDDWSNDSSSETGPGTDKCHFFVADIIEQAGGSVPKKWLGIGGPIGVKEWGDPKSEFLLADDNWELVKTQPEEGDVFSNGKHVAILTGYRTSTHAGKDKIVRDNWGFKPGKSAKDYTFWRYKN
ncbi:hypothetical protein SNE40_016779 [Patella caerulea]